MFIVLALASAAFYGAADFLGGLTSRRANTLAAVVVSQFAGLVFVALLLPLLPAASPSRGDFLWGAAAGLTGTGGVALLYHALSIGRMAIVAPTTAVCAVAIPVLVALVLGERPGAPALAGIALAIVAITLVSRAEDPPGSVRDPKADSALGLALLSGVAIGLFFLCLARTTREAGLLPLLIARLVSVPCFAALALVRRTPIRMPVRVGMIAVGGGALDMLANLLYLIATRYGPLSLAVTLSSLYPASTVILARFTLGERLSRWQTVGVVCALIAVLLIVGST